MGLKREPKRNNPSPGVGNEERDEQKQKPRQHDKRERLENQKSATNSLPNKFLLSLFYIFK